MNAVHMARSTSLYLLGVSRQGTPRDRQLRIEAAYNAYGRMLAYTAHRQGLTARVANLVHWRAQAGYDTMATALVRFGYVSHI